MSRSVIPFIDSLGIRSKESPELHPDLAFIMDTIFTIIPFFDPKHEMEMSWKQIVRIQVGNRMDVSLVQVQEVSVITVIYNLQKSYTGYFPGSKFGKSNQAQFLFEIYNTSYFFTLSIKWLINWIRVNTNFP